MPNTIAMIPNRKPRTKKAIVEYLKSHFRYNTMNSWNNSTSYAHNIKIHHLEWESRELENRAFEMMELTEAYDDVNWILEEFATMYNYSFQIVFNGHNGGYLVLIHGGKNGDRIYVQLGLDIDQGEDFIDPDLWDLSSLRSRMELVWDFDQACKDAVETFQEFVKTHIIVEEEVEFTKKIKVAQEID